MNVICFQISIYALDYFQNKFYQLKHIEAKAIKYFFFLAERKNRTRHVVSNNITPNNDVLMIKIVAILGWTCSVFTRHHQEVSSKKIKTS